MSSDPLPQNATPKPGYAALRRHRWSTEGATLHVELGIPASYASTRGLVLYSEAAEADLVAITSTRASCEIRLIRSAADAWQQMQSTALSEGITLLPLSGFRSVARQTEIIRTKLAAGRSIDAILSVNAAPGYSEHHTGRALDIGTLNSPDFQECFAETPAFAWLIQHANSFGFTLSYPPNNKHGIAYEPWHWCWCES
jgi:D-alanyl-D-alanine carboxypeptidase